MIPSGEYDVIVVGGGPAGSSCAMVLARHGVRVLLLEKSRFPRDKICGDCINPRLWPLFDTLGVAHAIRDLMGPPISSITIRNTGGKHLEISLPREQGGPFFAMSRKVLDEILLHRASLDGVEVKQETRVTDIRWGNGWGVSTRAAGENEDVHFACSDIVGADGRNSLVARWVAQTQLAHARWKQHSAGVPNRVGIQWHTRRQSSIGASLEMVVFDSGYSGLVNLDDKTANIAMVVQAKTAKLAYSDFPEFLSRTIWKDTDFRDRFRDITPLGEIHTSAPIGPRAAARASPHARFIGDAQHIVEPFTGQGILFAVHDGITAAWEMLKERGITPTFPRPAPLSRFMASRFFSFMLRDRRLANRMINIALGYSPVVPWITRRIL